MSADRARMFGRQEIIPALHLRNENLKDERTLVKERSQRFRIYVFFMRVVIEYLGTPFSTKTLEPVHHQKARTDVTDVDPTRSGRTPHESGILG